MHTQFQKVGPNFCLLKTLELQWLGPHELDSLLLLWYLGTSPHGLKAEVRPLQRCALQEVADGEGGIPGTGMVLGAGAFSAGVCRGKGPGEQAVICRMGAAPKKV